MSINGAIAVSLIPEIAKLNILNRYKELNEKVNFSIFMTIFIVVPIMIGIIFYSEEIINLLYPNANKGAELLRLASVSIIFSSLTQTISGILQGVGEVKSYLKVISISMIIKLILNLILIPIDGLLEKGAVISSIIYDIIIFIFVYNKMKEMLRVEINILNSVFRVFMISIISTAFSKIIVNSLNVVSNRINTVMEILGVAIIYVVLSFLIFKRDKLNEKIFKINNSQKRLKNQ